MFKQKPQEDRDSPKAAAGGKGSLLRRRWKLLAVCALCSMLAAPASASGSNAAVQTAVVLGGLASGQTASLEGPFVAGESTQLPFEPAAVYRNDEAAASTRLEQYDVYYYNENTRTVWIYDTRAAGRITAVSPSASAPTAVTVAGTEYTIGTASAAAQISSLNGGGVGQVVTLLLGMDDQVVRVLTGDQADAVFYGVVQSASRSLTEDNGADVQQSVAVACTDGVTRTVHVDKSLNFPAGWLVEITVGTNASGDVTSMTQLMPVMVDQLGAAWVKSGEDRYETADDMQVYLWYKGQYYPTTLAKVDAENYHLIGWYDSMGCAAGGKVRVLVAVKKD
ncbi:hypothetical protein [Faecalibacterium sp. An58]|uniref:hypothetical protein n=1 Tax=Faecalibacterium sp. An58 TaxID=1965648 RepID=UPI00195024C7